MQRPIRLPGLLAMSLACVFASTASAQVSGFGAATTPSQVPGFSGNQQTSEKSDQAAAPTNDSPQVRRGPRDNSDRPRDERRLRLPRRALAAPSNRSTQSLAAQTDQYVRGLMDQHDKNRSGRLEDDELKSLPAGLANADRNRDQVVTFEELRAHVRALNTSAAGGNSSAAIQSSAAGSSSAGNASRAQNQAAPPNKRVVVEPPSRFKSRDADGDGQVAMSEYSRSWTDSLAAEFRSYDKNNDGFITAREAP